MQAIFKSAREDLYCTGGGDFSHNNLSTSGKYLTKTLNEEYGLQVSVSEI
jgi:hypothetical protein